MIYAMKRSFALLGALCALLAVAVEAFGTHSLSDTLSQEPLAIFETVARYQMYHALALLSGWLTLAWVVVRGRRNTV